MVGCVKIEVIVMQVKIKLRSLMTCLSWPAMIKCQPLSMLSMEIYKKNCDQQYFQSVVIACPVDGINLLVLKMVPTGSLEYLSYAYISRVNAELGDFYELYNIEYSNATTISNFPHISCHAA
jgi:hypothetical protein